MIRHPWPVQPTPPAAASGDLITDYRARLAHERMQADERRELQRCEQRSTLNAPDARIRAWERLHEVDLPLSPSHRLVGIIAAATSLTPEQVREEQRLRADAAKHPGAVPAAAAAQPDEPQP
jgi:hypothetical protein